MKASEVRPALQETALLRPHMPELDVVRGLAVLLVLLYHGVAPPVNGSLSATGKMLLAISQHGWMGVNLFFVLSGFLITGILVDNKSHSDYFRRFYLRRALRILPALYAVLIILLASGFISWRFLTLSILFLANCAPLCGLPLQYGPLWSLAVEEHFYFMWPGLIRRLSWSSLMLVLAFIAMVTPAIRALGFAMTGYRPDFVAVYTWFNLDGLALGALLAIWLRQPFFRRHHLNRTALMLLASGVAASVLLPDQRVIGVMFSTTACNVASAGLLSSMLLVGTGRWCSLVDRPVLKFLGYISYGLYLIHVLAFRMAEIILSRSTQLLSTNPIVVMALRFLIGVVIAISIAYLSRHYFEEKFLHMGFASRRPAISAEPVPAEP